MSITTDGIEAEKKARLFLRNKGLKNIQQLDWLLKKDGKYYAIEVKHRELFEPPPFWGTGLDIRQIKLRKQLYDDLGIDTILMVFVGDIVYWQILFSVLEKTEYFDTRNNIRIYNIDEFKNNKKE